MPPFQNILNNRSMDNLFLNRMITPRADKPAGGQGSRQGGVMKKQETTFEISIGSSYYFQVLLKIRFRCAPVFSLVFAFSFDPTRTIPKPLRQHPIKKRPFMDDH
jgi:hypothetical protein